MARESFEWADLCSHGALIEGVDEDIGLTPDELEKIAAATKETDRLYQYDYHVSFVPTPLRNSSSSKQTITRSKLRAQNFVSKKPKHSSYSIARRAMLTDETLSSSAEKILKLVLM